VSVNVHDREALQALRLKSRAEVMTCQTTNALPHTYTFTMQVILVSRRMYFSRTSTMGAAARLDLEYGLYADIMMLKKC
jgi:hypothetical protein